MFTSIGRAAAQRLVIRAAPASALPRIARRSFATTQWVRLPVKASSATTKKATTAKPRPPPKKTATPKKKAIAAEKQKKADVPKKKKTNAEKRKEAEKKLSPEEQLTLKTKRQIKQLKTQALLKEEPRTGVISPWLLYTADAMKAARAEVPMEETMPKIAEQYKNLSSYERQNLEKRAIEFGAQQEAVHKAWIESLDPRVTYAANVARRRLRVLLKKTATPRLLVDERLPKRPITAWTAFISSQFSNGYSGVLPTKALPDIAARWKAMSSAEKAPFESQANAARERYVLDVKSILGRESKSTLRREGEV